ncbi:ABC-2 type transport system ATP-binding protein [Kribbella orskensis]|uniref:ABC-2 type transport system ATP-binding protein n=1 Tax=Kribbella orskensis TaxID=2512216 RepID=A0ABY2BQ41_9ACTN|nr:MULTISPECIES: ATP-binding cassette domain-containing protein [Kribbella]TCN41988.1 ABC-2 type transport system ATP-binding protein [Kribbella sp. VKM Ac-2500]TCO25866.1 ABC-2 type transport system ATP-binding protein [Kribbella orskensis]
MSETAAPLVEVTGLTKRYGDTLAVDGVDLTVLPGEVYGFLGPNGAGKTTALRILTGLIAPTSGTVRVLGGAPGQAQVLARTGSMIESPAFYPYLSGLDNLRLLAEYAEVPRARIHEVLALVDLTDRARDRFSTYSLGMKQRLGVAAALLKDPELVILDEPTNGLDPAGMRDMRRLIRELGADGRTVLLSSHLLGEVQQICDRVGIISQGKMVAEHNVEELRGQQELVIRAVPRESARSVLTEALGADTVHLYDDTLRVKVAPDRAAEVNRVLVEAGIAVSELRSTERALEDVFFELTTTHPEEKADVG